MSTVLIVPGLKSSGPTHWQTWMERRVPGAFRVRQQNWHDAHLPDWSSRVRRAISQAEDRVFIVAHSFGALAGVQAAADHASSVSGALLVAPADPEHFGLSEFLPKTRLPFPVIVVASRDDPWMTFPRAVEWAIAWGAEIVDLGEAGHINAESGFGPWPEGLALLQRLVRAADYRAAQELRAAFHLSRYASHREGVAVANSDGDRPSFIAKHTAIRQAARLLEAAGWTLREPHAANG